jgi:FkbM family methyltransferase
MTEKDLMSIREGLRTPRSFVTCLMRHPLRCLGHLLSHQHEAPSGIPEVTGPPALSPSASPETNVVESADAQFTNANDILSKETPVLRTEDSWSNLRSWPWRLPSQAVPANMPSGKPWPRISIVTPSYQQGEFIEQTIRSVLLQGYPNLEYIVIDGGSTDHTQTVLRRYESELDVCISEPDDGQADAINKGFQYATGEILSWLNSDDMHLPTTLFEVALAFEEAEALGSAYQVDIVCGKALLYSEKDSAIVHEHSNKFTRGISKLPLEINDFDLWQKSYAFFYQPEVFFTRRALNKIGGRLNPILEYALDYDLWIRMAKQEAYLYSTEACLAIFRLHDKQKTKCGDTITYPEHEAVSLFHRQNPDPEAFYLPENIVAKPRETIPPDIFSTRPISYHETTIGNYYLPHSRPQDITSRHMRVGRVVEPSVLEVAKQYIQTGTVVLEVGASYGQMAVLFSDLVGKDGMIFVFEPDEYRFAIVQKNVRANHRGNIRTIFCPALSRGREVTFFHEPDRDRSPGYDTHALALAPDGSAQHTLRALTIDELQIDQFISFFRVDLQGSGLTALQGAKETILKHRTPILFRYEEQFQAQFATTFQDYLDFIRSIAYRIERVTGGINYLSVSQVRKTCPGVSFPSREGNNVKQDRFIKTDMIQTSDEPFLGILCKFLRNRSEVDECTRFLQHNGYVSHSLLCKDWDLAHIIPQIGHGNFLDMGSSDSYILENVSLKRTNGKKYGIDRYDPDVPVGDVTYFKGDLLNTPLPDGSLDYITCLSVIEHQVDFKLFAREVSRLLAAKGKLFVTFDYWDPLLAIPVKAYDLDWQPLDRALVLSLIQSCQDHGLHMVQNMDWTVEDKVICWGYYSPHPDVAYTFGLLAFEKS